MLPFNNLYSSFRKAGCLLILFLHGIAAGAQNIVVNSSFTDINICTEVQQPCCPSGWFFVQKIPALLRHAWPEIPEPGKSRKLNVLVATRANPYRDYWQTMLLCPMEAGEKYELSVKLACGYIGPNLNDIGFYFTDGFIFPAKDTLLQPAGYVGLMDAKVKQLAGGWFQLTKIFRPAESHQFLIVGNFSPKQNREILHARNIPDSSLSLAIADIEIRPLGKKICADAGRLKDSLYAIHERHFRMKEDDSGAAAVVAGPAEQPRVDTLQINNVQFAFNSYTLANPDTLDLLRPFIKDVRKIKVIGYTDDTGAETYNKTLSLKRAEGTARLIAQKFGIAASVIEAEGRGISTQYPGKEQNRRVEIYIYHL